jgi:hypothetical protein
MLLTRGERFQDARKALPAGKDTIYSVSAATGVSGSLIQALEDDENIRDVGYSKVTALAKYYGVSADYLLGLDEYPHKQFGNSTARDMGLSEKAVSVLCALNKRNDEKVVAKLLDTINTLIEHQDEHHEATAVLEYISAMLFSEHGRDKVVLADADGRFSIVDKSKLEDGSVPNYGLYLGYLGDTIWHDMGDQLLASIQYLRIEKNPDVAKEREKWLASLLNGGIKSKRKDGDIDGKYNKENQ